MSEADKEIFIRKTGEVPDGVREIIAGLAGGVDDLKDYSMEDILAAFKAVRRGENQPEHVQPEPELV